MAETTEQPDVQMIAATLRTRTKLDPQVVINEMVLALAAVAHTREVGPPGMVAYATGAVDVLRWACGYIDTAPCTGRRGVTLLEEFDVVSPVAQTTDDSYVVGAGLALEWLTGHGDGGPITSIMR